jgi:hypothetical protein
MPFLRLRRARRVRALDRVGLARQALALRSHAELVRFGLAGGEEGRGARANLAHTGTLQKSAKFVLACGGSKWIY